jgi:hypothetical protein
MGETVVLQRVSRTGNLLCLLFVTAAFIKKTLTTGCVVAVGLHVRESEVWFGLAEDP